MTTKMSSIVTPTTSMLPVPNLEPTEMQGTCTSGVTMLLEIVHRKIHTFSRNFLQ